jgi:hypothetical protein
MKRGFLKTFEIFFLEKTFKIWVGVIHGRGQYMSKYGTLHKVNLSSDVRYVQELAHGTA